jgi:hypothetical protein
VTFEHAERGEAFVDSADPPLRWETHGSAYPHPDAPDGKERKYAKPERERRFLLARLPSGEPIRRVLIEDRYFIGTRLRLRRTTAIDPEPDARHVTYKLGHKVPAPDGTPGLITNLYLSEAEYRALATVPSYSLRKTRSSYPPFGVDDFDGPLHGLILAEAEFDTDTAAMLFSPTIEVVAEVTADLRLTGGRLVVTTRDQLRAVLDEYGIT